jgi:hypothetical protein
LDFLFKITTMGRGGIALGFGANTSTSFSPAAVYPVSQNGGQVSPDHLCYHRLHNIVQRSYQHQMCLLNPADFTDRQTEYDPFASLTSSQPSSHRLLPLHHLDNNDNNKRINNRCRLWILSPLCPALLRQSLSISTAKYRYHRFSFVIAFRL